MNETEVLEPTAGADEAQPTAETPAAPASVAPSAPGDEPAITEPAAPLATRPRGPDGRFIKADGTQASEAEHAAIEAAAPASPPPPVPQTPAPTAPPGEPFVFRADGQKFPIPGSSVSPDGHLTIPAEQVPAIRQLLAEGVTHRGSWRKEREDFQRQVTEAGAVQGARAEKYNAAAILMLSKIDDPAWLAAAVADPREVQMLKREIGLALQAADLKAPKETPAPTQAPEVEQQQLETAARRTLAEYVEELLESPQAKALFTTPEERKAAIARYARRMNAYFVENDGEVVLHENAVDEDFNEEIKLRQAGRQAALEAQKAAEFNARRNAPAVTAPPVVSTKGPSSTGTAGGRTFKTKEEYRAAMGLG